MSTKSDISFTKEDLESLEVEKSEREKRNSILENYSESNLEQCDDLTHPINQQIDYLTNRFKILKEMLNSPVNSMREELFDYDLIKEEEILNNKNLLSEIINEK